MSLYKNFKSLFYYIFIFPYYRILFKELGLGSKISSPLKIDGASNIYIGSGVTIAYKTWLGALPQTGQVACKLVIGNGSSIGHFNHIYATTNITIGRNVLTADKVYISDNLHSYENVNLPISHQPIKQISTVTIGDGAWLGENVCIIGANVGKGSVIGANSVVTKDIPDYCIAVGSPARIIKRYSFEAGAWLKSDHNIEITE
ncbi:acetyltransferase [Mucilaginibacter sp. PAMC 26640]|nr:acetyltransferase [Mucilaginibacter sp. PAMC 26640]